MAGETTLKNGVKVPSVFRVDTDAGRTLLGSYWMVKNEWWDFQDRPNAFRALALDEIDVFPFDWSYLVKLQEDIYHD